MTNLEYIRTMSIDEMAEAIAGSTYPCAICPSPNARTTKMCKIGDCKKYVKKWLMEETEV